MGPIVSKIYSGSKLRRSSFIWNKNWQCINTRSEPSSPMSTRQGAHYDFYLIVMSYWRSSVPLPPAVSVQSSCRSNKERHNYSPMCLVGISRWSDDTYHHNHLLGYVTCYVINHWGWPALIIVGMEGGQFDFWVEVFQTQCRDIPWDVRSQATSCGIYWFANWDQPFWASSLLRF